MKSSMKSWLAEHRAAVFLSSGLVVAGIIFYLALDQHYAWRDVSGTIGRRTKMMVAEKVDAYLSENLYQEAAWEYLKIDNKDAAAPVLDSLNHILHSAPAAIKPFGKRVNVSETFLVTFQNGVKGVFKVENSDSLGPVNREVAVYKLDQLLGFNLTPMTIVRQLDLPDGRRATGSLMYFVNHCKPGLETPRQKTDELRLFDAIIGNSDRHERNWLVRETGEIIAIDHNRTFRHDNTGVAATDWHKELKMINDPSALGKVYSRFKKLPPDEFRHAIAGVIAPDRFRLFLDAREEIIDQIEKRKKDQAWLAMKRRR